MHAPRLLASTLFPLLAACSVVSSSRDAIFGRGSRAEPQPACAEAAFPDDRFVGPAFTDKFTGRYWKGSEHLDVWRQDQRMFIGSPAGPRRQLERASDIPGEGLFRDGCGIGYHFILPPDGPGGMLRMTEPNGARSQWRRRV